MDKIFAALGLKKVPMMRLSDWAISVSAVLLLLSALTLFDDRVRDQFSYRIAAHPTQQLSAAGEQVRDMGAVIFEAARDQSIEHAPMMFFVMVGIILVLFMLRT